MTHASSLRDRRYHFVTPRRSRFDNGRSWGRWCQNSSCSDMYNSRAVSARVVPGRALCLLSCETDGNQWIDRWGARRGRGARLDSSGGMALSAEALRPLDSETRHRFKKHPPPLRTSAKKIRIDRDGQSAVSCAPIPAAQPSHRAAGCKAGAPQRASRVPHPCARRDATTRSQPRRPDCRLRPRRRRRSPWTR
jgi:hypothetical protein